MFNRNLAGLGLGAAAFAALNVWFTVLFYDIMCNTVAGYNACSPVSSMIAKNGASGVVNLLFPTFFLFPAFLFILILWFWLAGDLRRAGKTTLSLWTYSFPVIALVVGVIIMLIASLISEGAVAVYPMHMWVGSWSLAVWPLLIALVAWRTPPAPAQAEEPAAEPAETAEAAQ